MLVKLYINEVAANGANRGYFEGETPAITVRTNCVEISKQPVLFCGDTRQSVIDQVIFELKARKLSGKLRVI